MTPSTARAPRLLVAAPALDCKLTPKHSPSNTQQQEAEPALAKADALAPLRVLAEYSPAP